MDQPNSRPWVSWWLPAIVLLSIIGFQYALFIHLDRVNPMPDYDEAVYADVARQFALTGVPLRRMGETPLLYAVHPYLQMAIWSFPHFPPISVFPEPTVERALQVLHRDRWITSAFGFAALIWMTVACRWRREPGLAVMALLLLGLDPMWLRYAHAVYLEVPVAFWIFGALELLSIRLGGSTRKGLLVLSGFCLGCAAITKYTAGPAVIAAACIFVVSFRRLGGWRSLLFFLTPFLCLCATWPLLGLRWGRWDDWVAGHWGRAHSFTAGTLGDPRTEWGAADLLQQSFLAIGVVHAFLLLTGFLGFIGMFWSWKRTELSELESSNKPDMRLVVHSLFAAIFVVCWIAAPTRDPKFLVSALPSLVLIASSGLLWALRQAKGLYAPSGVNRTAIGVTAACLLLVALPIDLLGIDQTRFSWVYPTRHAISQSLLPHGRNYLPIAERLRQKTSSDIVIPVGRQGPIVGYLADRRYQPLYLLPDRDSVDQYLMKSGVVVVDDSWRHCLPGEVASDHTDWLARFTERFEQDLISGRITLSFRRKN